MLNYCFVQMSMHYLEELCQFSYHLLAKLRSARYKFQESNSRNTLELSLMTADKLLPAPVDLLPQGVVPCLPATQVGRAVRNCCPHPRCFCWLGCIRLSSLWLQLKCVMKDMVFASSPLWTLICFFQSAVNALVVSSKVFKLILTRLQSLMGNM